MGGGGSWEVGAQGRWRLTGLRVSSPYSSMSVYVTNAQPTGTPIIGGIMSIFCTTVLIATWAGKAVISLKVEAQPEQKLQPSSATKTRP